MHNLMMSKELEELKAQNEALKRKVAFLSKVLETVLKELERYVSVDAIDEIVIRESARDYAKYLQKKEHDREWASRVAVGVFLPLAYKYMVEKGRPVKYDAFIEWLRDTHPRVYQSYAKETITRALRALREMGYLVSPKGLQGVFLITEKGLEKVAELTGRRVSEPFGRLV